MKLLKITVVFILFTAFLVVENSRAFATYNPYRSRCVGIQGTFYANSTWKGGSIQVGCGGDDGLAIPASRRQAEACLGEVQTVRPGQTFRLTKCSCFGSDKGCLKIGQSLTLLPQDSKGNRQIKVVKTIQSTDAFKANSCEVSLNGAVVTGSTSDKVCGSNGQHITGNIKISCSVPPINTLVPAKSRTPTPTPTSVPPINTLVPAKSRTPTPSIPLPGGVTPTACPTPGKVTNVRISCPNCTEDSVEPTPEVG